MAAVLILKRGILNISYFAARLADSPNTWIWMYEPKKPKTMKYKKWFIIYFRWLFKFIVFKFKIFNK